MYIVLVILSLICSSSLGSIVGVTDIDTNYYYRLVNKYKGDQWALGVIDNVSANRLEIQAVSSFAGQYWRLTP